MMHETVRILGVNVDCVDFAQTLDLIEQWIARARGEAAPPQPRQICTVNPEFIIDAWRDPDFAAMLASADLRVPDGVGVLWAARLLRHPLRERVTGSDGIYRISERAAERGWRLFFLGAAPGVAERAAVILRERNPGLIIAGAYSGSPAASDWPEIEQMLGATRPDVLFVAFGHPKQDFWIAGHRQELPCALAIGVGGAFDFVAGVTVRAPVWVQRLGLEWLHRLLRQPWRWRRMVKLPLFVWLVSRQWVVGE
jgi:N-acetylglucosaminyldiphosphoundecaprenol N-acetyl-beta-D-mannosaminyltransferase